MHLSHRFDAALSLMMLGHRTHTRKAGSTPYVCHLLAVAGVVLEYGGTEDEAIAALLHDLLEDRAAHFGGAAALEALLAEQFGPTVLALVLEHTDATVQPKPPWRQRKEEALAALAHHSASAQLIVCADLLCNLRSLLADLREHGPAVWARFNGGATGTQWYYAQVLTTLHRLQAGTQERWCRIVVELDETWARIVARVAKDG
jgi:(p)ppGpp synthase/HD superfamily hydrolase